MTISEAFKVFDTYYLINENKTDKTRKEYNGRILGKNGIATVLGDIPIDELGIDHVLGWKLHLRGEGLQPVYVNHCLSGFRMFIKWLSENEFNVFDWQKIKFDKEPQNKPHTVLTPEEIEKLIKATTNIRDKAIIKLFFGTGMRSAELISIDRDQWESAQLVNHNEVVKERAEPMWEIYIEGKNSKYRPVLFFQDVKNAVDAYLDSRDDKYRPLFISLQNRRIHWNTIGRMLHDVSRKAGLDKHVTQHVLRHSYATEMGANGMPIPVLSYNLGHSNGTVTQKVYIHMNAMHARRSYASAHPARV